MRWIDMHCDTVSEALKRGENIERNNLCADVERLLQSGARAQFFACFVNAAEYGYGNKSIPESRVWDEAYRKVLEMTESVQKAESGRFRIAVKPEQICRDGDALSGILAVEEGGILNGRPERLDELYDRGVRLLTLTWNYKNCIGSPNSREQAVMEQGLSRFGFCVLEQMNSLGMIIDVSHLSDAGFRDCIARSSAPVVASHSNARALCRHPRNLSDRMLRVLGEKGGVAGVNFYSPFLRERGKAELSDIARHIRRMVRFAGEEGVALGSDFDGFAPADCPAGLSGVTDMEKIWAALEKEGFTQRQIEMIAWDNAKRIINDVWR